MVTYFKQASKSYRSSNEEDVSLRLLRPREIGQHRKWDQKLRKACHFPLLTPPPQG